MKEKRTKGQKDKRKKLMKERDVEIAEVRPEIN
jgi:hypothetical protein